jgi:hypothetical protein
MKGEDGWIAKFRHYGAGFEGEDGWIAEFRQYGAGFEDEDGWIAEFKQYGAGFEDEDGWIAEFKRYIYPSRILKRGRPGGRCVWWCLPCRVPEQQLATPSMVLVL